MKPYLLWLGWVLCAVAGAACDPDFERMTDQAKFEAYERNPFFPDGTTMQRPPLGTVHRQQELDAATCLECEEIPVAVTAELLQHGRNRYNIYCGACHGVLGDGDTKVAENMTLRPPPSLHQDRIRAYPAGRLYIIITSGYGLMRSYADDLSITDRWAVVAYVQALQLSQYARLSELPPQMREEARAWLSK